LTGYDSKIKHLQNKCSHPVEFRDLICCYTSIIFKQKMVGLYVHDVFDPIEMGIYNNDRMIDQMVACQVNKR